MPRTPIFLAAFLCLPAVAHHGGHTKAPPVAITAEAAVVVGAGDLRYESVAGWCRLPDERPLGNTHGAIVIDQAGTVYYNTDTERSIMAHAPDGAYVRAFAAQYPGIHGMVLRVEDGREYIYAAHLAGRQVVKIRMDGTTVWKMGVPKESGKYDDDPGAFRPTSVAVAPDGRIYVADGYGRNWIHVFAPDRTYIKSFGGHGDQPGQFRTCHGIAIDTRGEAPRLVVCDRENRRIQRFDLDGNLVDVATTGLRRPCAVAFWKDLTAVAELEGRVTILDRSMQPAVHLGDNPKRDQWANNGVPAEAWSEGVFTAPHGCCFDEEGNLYVMDWNATGRISKLRRLAAP